MSLTLRDRVLLFLVPNYLYFFKNIKICKGIFLLFIWLPTSTIPKAQSICFQLGSVLRWMELGHTPPLLVFGYLSAMRALGKMLFFLSSASSEKSKLVEQDQFGLSTHLFRVRL